MNPPKTTPMIKQYLTIKDQYPDAILFYRMGDFYEMFFEDAEKASRILEITLTSRNKKEETPIPMCGVPQKAAQGYIARLINQGYKVAICDQIEDPSIAKGLVKREVVRVITPGMIIENELLEEKTNNYILALYRNEAIYGIAYLDISTAAFRLSESNDQTQITDEILRVSPSELLVPKSAKMDSSFSSIFDSISKKAITYLDDNVFRLRRSRERLLKQFKTISLEGFGCEHLTTGVRAAGALIYYIQETQKQKLEHITTVETYSLNHFLVLDDLSHRNLEIMHNLQSGSRQGTLIGILDRTVTAMGGRLLKKWLRYPHQDVQKIESRLDAVEEAKTHVHIRRTIREHLKSIYDLERLGSKIVMGHSNARDLVALKRSFYKLPDIKRFCTQLQSELCIWNADHDNLGVLADLIEKAIREDAPPIVHEGGMIKTGYDSELDELVNISRGGKEWLARLEVRERNTTGINALKVRYNKVFGYYIEVPKAKTAGVPSHYARKQTLVNAERYITDELKSFESKVLEAEERRASLEYDIFNRIRAQVVKNNASIQQAAQFLARLDCLLALADTAAQNNYCRPQINTEGYISINEGRHPVVEKMITAERFVPNSIVIDNAENQVLIITGPNMAGKSTVLRQVALQVLMAHVGSFVPAQSASICATDRIFTRVGALDNLSQGQSTFMVEMQETANILNNSTAQSLVIMDEIGRGTSTFDGLSIAWAVAEYLHDLNGRGVKTLFATHYHELTDLALTKPRVKNYNIAVKEWNDEIIFLRKLVEGGTNRSYGIQVARLAGIPSQVLKRAKKILSEIEKSEHTADGLPTIGQSETVQIKRDTQLSLFRQPEDFVIEKLNRIDISKLTPLEALNVLNHLQDIIKTA
jgi:DNA mismatch repair protein MutS